MLKGGSCRRVHLPCAPASASPEQLCPPPSPKILSPELGGCLHLKWPKHSREIGFSWCLKAAAARRAGLGFGKEKVFSRVDQGLGFPSSAQTLPGVLSPGKQIETEIS